MRKSVGALVIAAASAAAVGFPIHVSAADVQAAPASPHTLTGNVGLFSQYVFRGLTQTNEKPALQGGFDYAHSGGFYAGVWASNISWFTDNFPAGNSVSLEIDTYLGFKNTFPGSEVSYDVGFLRYNYPGTFNTLPAGIGKPNTNEIYGSLGYKWFTAKYSYSLGDTFAIKDARGSDYIDLAANFELPEKFGLGFHVGRQHYKGTNAALWAGTGLNNDVLTYTDYRVSLTKDINGYILGLAFTNTNAKGSVLTPAGIISVYNNGFGRNVGRSQAVLSIYKSF